MNPQGAQPTFIIDRQASGRMIPGEGEGVAVHFPGIAAGSENERQHGDAMTSGYASAIDATLRTVRRLVAEGKLSMARGGCQARKLAPASEDRSHAAVMDRPSVPECPGTNHLTNLARSPFPRVTSRRR